MSALCAPLEDLQTKLAQRLEEALADNRTVYLEVEPAAESLAKVVPAVMVKALPPAAPLGPPLFAALLPAAVGTPSRLLLEFRLQSRDCLLGREGGGNCAGAVGGFCTSRNTGPRRNQGRPRSGVAPDFLV